LPVANFSRTCSSWSVHTAPTVATCGSACGALCSKSGRLADNKEAQIRGSDRRQPTAPFIVMDTLMRSSGIPSNRSCGEGGGQVSEGKEWVDRHVRWKRTASSLPADAHPCTHPTPARLPSPHSRPALSLQPPPPPMPSPPHYHQPLPYPNTHTPSQPTIHPPTFMSSTESTATPAMPTSPPTRGWSLS